MYFGYSHRYSTIDFDDRFGGTELKSFSTRVYSKKRTMETLTDQLQAV
jgi:hypothetical protein